MGVVKRILLYIRLYGAYLSNSIKMRLAYRDQLSEFEATNQPPLNPLLALRQACTELVEVLSAGIRRGTRASTETGT
jgi:hypothetical protein